MIIFYFVFLALISDSVFGGHTCTYNKNCYRSVKRHCGTWGWSRCWSTQAYTCYYQDCCSGWTGSGCNTPICTTPCYNGGTCVGPDHCDCPRSHGGKYCTTLLCSHKSPCYPGTCSYPRTCSCFNGFSGSSRGCLTFSSQNNPPVMSECEFTLARIRRTDDKQLFYFNKPCSGGSDKDTIWCNQELFNYANFSMKSLYPSYLYLPPAPSYVSSHAFGIVSSGMSVKHTKYPRSKTGPRLVAFDVNYACPDLSNSSPEQNIAQCTIIEKDYIINIEHDDIFTVTYSTKSGGYRQLYNIDNHRNYTKQYYTGQTVSKMIEFKFDFVAPVHCSETSAPTRCSQGEEPIHTGGDITKDPIQPRWSGWSDSLSGIAYYYLEIFKLEPNIHGDLTELNPLNPLFTFRTNLTSNINFPTYTPTQSGMYSILLQASDQANNSKIARRLVLYDNDSEITLAQPNKFLSGKAINVTEISMSDGGMHVTSAIPETGYMWQTSKIGSKTHIVLEWEDHFVNKIYDSEKLLNLVLAYPTQFANLKDDGILRSTKYVALNDSEGERTGYAIPNIHGIVKFETKRVFTDDRQEPTSGWAPHTLSQHYDIRELLADGSHLRMWVRATDIMNHTKADYTEVHIDNSPPRVADMKLDENIVNGTHTHTSRITFIASDDGSGVHLIEYKLFVGNKTEIQGTGQMPAHRNNDSWACGKDPKCNCVLNTCFLIDQMVDIDNCLFLVPKEELNRSATINVTVYNQALLHQDFSLTIPHLTDLHGLEEYSGPTNIRVENNLATGVRLVWDLPKTASCYGRADIVIALVNSDGSVRVVNVYNEGTSVDLVGLDPDKDYSISLNLGYKGTQLAALPYTFKTAPRENYLAGGVIAAMVVGVLVIIGLMLAIFAVLLRRGHMQPVRRGLTAMSVKYRKSVARTRAPAREQQNDHGQGYSNRESLYMYGEMDFKDVETWQLGRGDIILESFIKSGSFADIYKATMRTSRNTVVAKTLKTDWKEHDEFLMKAKINFNSTVVGHHDNVLRFIGAVVADTDIGPFIIYEYCSNGQLREYLETMKNNITIETQEQILRFGLGVVRGMDYLSQRKIVHCRLAARNILLDDHLETKISGFGPQPEQNKEGDGQATKRERIPMKWMAPECLKSTASATEKSDVWSFGIVLWEIFSLGESPYGDVRGRELPAKLKGGYRLPKPEQCDDKWYDVMKRAWAEKPVNRPTFAETRKELDEVFVPAATDDYYYYRK